MPMKTNKKQGRRKEEAEEEEKKKQDCESEKNEIKKRKEN